jgi:hypothetical protein
LDRDHLATEWQAHYFHSSELINYPRISHPILDQRSLLLARILLL